MKKMKDRDYIRKLLLEQMTLLAEELKRRGQVSTKVDASNTMCKVAVMLLRKSLW